MFRKKHKTLEGLGSQRIVAFVSTVDAAKAKDFYTNVLGLRLLSEDPFALVFDAGGTKLRVSVVKELTVAPYTILGWLVPDIHQAASELRRRGVAFLRIDGIEQDEYGVWSGPRGAKVAWFRDPDGNTLSITKG